MDKFPKEIILGGACILGLTLALGWGGVNMMIKGQIRKEIRLINKTDTYNAWRDFPIPIYLNVYFFNITNAEELTNGAKPILKEIGPYVYTVKLTKTDLAINDTTEVITFRPIKHYFFQPRLSTGTEDDLVTIPNIPLFGLAKIAEELSDSTALFKSLDALVSKKEEQITRTHTVGEILFDGFSISNYFTENFAKADADGGEAFTLPESYAEEKYGFFKHKNGTPGELFDIENGRNLTYLFGQIISYNEEPELTWWRGPCNQLKAADGITFHPFINQTSPIYVFESTFCRRLTFNFNETVRVNEVESYRFRLAPETFLGPHEYPENGCFCPVENSTKCHRSGVYDLAPCNHGVPLLLSKPHFLGADEQILTGVSGVNPDPELHESFLDLHSMSGIPLKTAKRFQFNIELISYPSIASAGKLSKSVTPIMWYQESIEAGSMHFLVFKIISWIQAGWDLVKYALMGAGGIVLVSGVLMACMRKTIDSEDKVVLVK